jgi:hypothetical protein
LRFGVAAEMKGNLCHPLESTYSPVPLQSLRTGDEILSRDEIVQEIVKDEGIYFLCDFWDLLNYSITL